MAHLSEIKSSIKNELVKFVSNDLRPFNIINGNGFEIFCDKLVSIGAKYGKVDNILPDSTTVSRIAIKKMEHSKRKLSEIIPPVLQSIGGGFTTDMWTDPYKKNSYICLTCHYIEDWEMVERVLGTFLFKHEKKLAVNIKDELLNKLAEYNLNTIDSNRFVFVTDGASNMINAVKEFQHIVCITHRINTIERTSFTEKNFLEYPEVIKTIENTKSLVTYLKRTGLACRYRFSIKQETETRWNSKYVMLNSVLSQYNEIEAVLRSRGLAQLISDIKIDILKSLVSVLKLFKIASEELESSKKPTIHLVLPWLEELKEHCKCFDSDSKYTIKIKTVLREVLEKKYKIHILHKVATFLNPRMKKLKSLDSEEKRNVLSYVRELICKFFNKEVEDIYNPSKKKKKLQFLRTVDSSSDDEKDEIDNYLISSKSSREDSHDILTWWENNERKLPKLANLAKFILAIPASSAPSERDFSASGLTITQLRSSLDPSTVNSILFLRSNNDLLNETENFDVENNFHCDENNRSHFQNSYNNHNNCDTMI